MKDFLKWAAISVAVLGVIVTATWLWRDSVWREKIATTPAVRDTTVTVVRDTVQIPVIRADTVYVRTVDSTASTPRWWVAVMDTSLEYVQGVDTSTVHVHAEYNSPTPLSMRGFFSDFSVQLPPRIDSVRTVYVTETRTVYEETVAWEATVITGSACLVLGAFLMGAAQ